MELENKYGNTKWIYTTYINMCKLNKYDTFKDIGKDYPVPVRYTIIFFRLVYNIKHDGRHKTRLVYYGHLTDIPFKKYILYFSSHWYLSSCIYC